MTSDNQSTDKEKKRDVKNSEGKDANSQVVYTSLLSDFVCLTFFAPCALAGRQATATPVIRFQSGYANEILIMLSFGCWGHFAFFFFFFFIISFPFHFLSLSLFFQLLVIAARYHSGASIAAPNPSPKVHTTRTPRLSSM